MRHLYVKRWGAEDREPDRPKIGLDWFSGAGKGFYIHVDFFKYRYDLSFIPRNKRSWYEKEFGQWAGRRLW